MGHKNVSKIDHLFGESGYRVRPGRDGKVHLPLGKNINPIVRWSPNDPFLPQNPLTKVENRDSMLLESGSFLAPDLEPQKCVRNRPFAMVVRVPKVGRVAT